MNTRIGADPSAQRAAFDALLARLRHDGDAGLGYEALRRRLLQLFRLHSPAEAGALADVTLDRLARKIGEGTEIDNVPLYTLGIARMVLHEANAHAAQWHMVDTDPASIAATDESDDAESLADDAVMAALTRCLDDAGPTTRALVLAYYTAEGSERIATRQRLAAEQKISVNALRNRMLRLRDALEHCVLARLGTTNGS